MTGDVAGGVAADLDAASAAEDPLATMLEARFLLVNALVGAHSADAAAGVYTGALALARRLGDAAPHRVIAVASNNLASELVEAKTRTPGEDALMAAAAEAAHEFWMKIGTWVHDERARYLKALVANALGRPEEALAEADASTGIRRLDAMLSGKGYYRGASVLISGAAGTGKTSIAAHFAAACCARNERCLYFAFEESPQQLVRNMRSIGLDLQPWIDKQLLQIHSARPSLHGLEMHLALVHKAIRDFGAQGVVIDPISNFAAAGTSNESRAMLTRLIDFLKSRQITSIFTSLVGGMVSLDEVDVGVSSIIDTWLVLRDLEMDGKRRKSLYVLKSRGMAHSNQSHAFRLTDQGIDLAEWQEIAPREPANLGSQSPASQKNKGTLRSTDAR